MINRLAALPVLCNLVAFIPFPVVGCLIGWGFGIINALQAVQVCIVAVATCGICNLVLKVIFAIFKTPTESRVEIALRAAPVPEELGRLVAFVLADQNGVMLFTAIQILYEFISGIGIVFYTINENSLNKYHKECIWIATLLGCGLVVPSMHLITTVGFVLSPDPYIWMVIAIVIHYIGNTGTNHRIIAGIVHYTLPHRAEVVDNLLGVA